MTNASGTNDRYRPHGTYYLRCGFPPGLAAVACPGGGVAPARLHRRRPRPRTSADRPTAPGRWPPARGRRTSGPADRARDRPGGPARLHPAGDGRPTGCATTRPAGGSRRSARAAAGVCELAVAGQQHAQLVGRQVVAAVGGQRRLVKDHRLRPVQRLRGGVMRGQRRLQPAEAIQRLRGHRLTARGQGELRLGQAKVLLLGDDRRAGLRCGDVFESGVRCVLGDCRDIDDGCRLGCRARQKSRASSSAVRPPARAAACALPPAARRAPGRRAAGP